MWPRRDPITPSRIAQYTHSMNPAARISATMPNATATIPIALRRRCRVTLRNASHASCASVLAHWRGIVCLAKRALTGRDDSIIRPPALSTMTRERAPAFDYEQAFSRNVGWVTESEQRALRRKRIAIAGLGGVGGIELLTL